MLAGIFLFALCLSAPTARAEDRAGLPVLVYHRFGANVAYSMTVTDPMSGFTPQLQWLEKNG